MAQSADRGRGALEDAALSDIGLRRGNNQDAFTVSLAGDDAEWRRRGHLFMVADGMGAHAAGELASKMACEAVGHTYRKLVDRPAAEALRQAVLAANATIHQRGQANAEFQGMGTTSSALVLLPAAAIVAHVGDSRVYRLRRGKLEQLTFDHSLVWEMTAAGQMPRGEVASFIPKNIITRSLGPHPDVQVDMEGPFPLEAGDTFLVCSDGLSGQIKDEEIGALLVALEPADAVRVLVDVANLRGGPDNITAIVVRVTRVEAGEQPASPPEPAAAPGAAVHPALWGITAVCLLVALVLAVTGYYMTALVSVLLGAASAVVVLLQSMTGATPRDASQLEGPLGSGPHGARDCLPNADSVAAAAQLAQQLREATRAEHWTLDWARFDALGDEAQAALAARDYTAAVRHHALSISFMMAEIRRQAARKDHRDRSVLDW
ncbi:MAG: PP2C family serine/threonine-protein phosphatase [Pirellulales bacterium]